MGWHYMFCIITALLTQLPGRSAISRYSHDQRTHRRHIDSPYIAHYWETGLKEATYRTFLRKGYADPSLKDQIINAPLVDSDTEQATPFGDVAVLARGQLFYSAGGFFFVRDERSYDCDECDDRTHLLRRENRGQIVALWTVKRLRHHDNAGRYRYETEYLISPVKDEDYWRKNGDYNYDIPAFVFVLKNAQGEQSNFRNYLPDTPSFGWYDAKDNPKYLSASYNKVDRRYLPPATTTAGVPFYYAFPKDKYHEHRHYYDPDIIPAVNNVEKEAELYKKFLESLSTTQSTTKYEPQETSSGFDIFNRVTPIVSPPSTMMTSLFDFATTTSHRQNVHFPQTTPFRPSPMYTRYSEPDPLYTTTAPTTKVKSTFYQKPTTGTSTFHPSPELTKTTVISESKSTSSTSSTLHRQPTETTTTPKEKSTFYSAPTTITTLTTEKPIGFPREKSISHSRPTQITTTSMVSTSEILTTSSIPTKETTASVQALTNVYESTLYPIPSKTIETVNTTPIISTERSTSYDVTSMESTTKNYSIPITETDKKIISPQAIGTTIINTEKSTSLSSTPSMDQSTSYTVPTMLTSITTLKPMLTSESIKTSVITEKSTIPVKPVKSTSPFVEKSTFYSTLITDKSTKATTEPTKKSTVYQGATYTAEESMKTTQIPKLTESSILLTTYVAESPETTPARTTTTEKYIPTQESSSMFTYTIRNHSTISQIITTPSTKKPELDFDIFNIFDKPKKNKPDNRLSHEDVEMIKTQMISPEIIVRTTLGYVPTTQASSTMEKARTVTTSVQENTTSFEDALKSVPDSAFTTEAVTERYEAQSTNFVGDIFKNGPTAIGNAIPTMSYDEIHETMLVESTKYPGSAPTSNEISTKEFETTNRANVENAATTSNTIAYEITEEVVASTTSTIATPIGEEKLTIISMSSTKEQPQESVTQSTTESVKDVDIFSESLMERLVPKVTTESRVSGFNKKYKITTSRPRFKTTPKPTTTSTTRKYKYTKIPRRKDYKSKKFDALGANRTASSPGPIRYDENGSGFEKKTITADKNLKNSPTTMKNYTENTLIQQELETTTIEDRNSMVIEDQKTTIETAPTEASIAEAATSSISQNVTEITTLKDTVSEELQTKFPESSTIKIITPLSISMSVAFSTDESTNITDENPTEITTETQLLDELPKTNVTQDGNLETTSSRPLSFQLTTATAAGSKEIFEDLFGAFSKVTTPTTTPSTSKTTNDLNRKLEEELFGAPDQSLEDGILEDHSVQIEDTTAQAKHTPKIIFDNFYEASTPPPSTTESVDFDAKEAEIATTTTTLPTTAMCNDLLTQIEGAKDDSNLILKLVKGSTANERTPIIAKFHTDSSNKDFDAKDTNVVEIIMVDLKKQGQKRRKEEENDAIKANVARIDIGDDNVQVYKAELDEENGSAGVKQNSETDLFERLALSVVNNAKSIDYLNRKKAERKRKRKVIKQKVRRKEKQDASS